MAIFFLYLQNELFLCALKIQHSAGALLNLKECGKALVAPD
jgi:hypothetical protein